MNLLQQAEAFVSELLKDKLSKSFTYHNLGHTQDVVAGVGAIIGLENISPEDKEALLVAAWFHDTGYTKGCQNHEESSVLIASGFLKDKHQSHDFIAKVSMLIQATVYDYQPQNSLEKIIRDADYAHFGSVEYNKICEQLREEWKVTIQKDFTNQEWSRENLYFMENKHQYHSKYALEYWQPIKEQNIKMIKEKMKMGEEQAMVVKKVKKKKSKKEKPDRGIDTLFRITLSNHTRLSGIADSKANILLSVNAIIISIALSSIIPKLDSPNNAHLIIPTFILLMFSVVSIIFAILSTRPKVTTGTFTREDIEAQKVNLLFFGNFYKMPLDEYQWAVNELMKDRNYLYNSMIKDLYFLGIVLEKKYRLLRITYNIFMIGIIVSVIAFVLAFNSVLV
ncbi:Pycsar system effector family protein [Flavobacterium sp. 7A]|uniref:Pycsar system effector family protein n=1 Tax=Flavobacterium sp. 7A TaxID=2940571 RepID=UPI002226587E|nr:Pycsar system effector family protein [Flavobacterium sp. 7A]MCW2119492.1 putative metal-dependent HD superfamily phosphohydrolase [Flavobacterium sp. 7A]